MNIHQEIFKAYDIRGKYPDEINEEIVYKIAQAYMKLFRPKGPIVLGKDVRISSESLWQAAAKGINNTGYDVIDIGTISTDMLYFTVAYYGYGGGITISASHNPKDDNGMKFVREKAIAISADTGIMEIKEEVLKGHEIIEPEKGVVIKKDVMTDYIKHCLSFINTDNIKPMKIVADANFGMAGIVVEKMLADLPIEIIGLNFKPDGNFPKGRPDPKIKERREEISQMVVKEKADLGVAWDADADRCFVFDEKGQAIDAYYVTAILAKYILAKSKNKKILCDVRLNWAIQDVVDSFNGELVINKPGHAFIKDTMRQKDIAFGGETSGHYFFKDNYYTDNGMIPFLLILEMFSLSDQSMSEIADIYRNKYFNSGEINFEVINKDKVLKNIEKKYKDYKINKIDGLTVMADDYQFNIRKSNTEPVIRLNLEAKTQKMVDQKTEELKELIK